MYDAYVRVSSVKGRSGESYISPQVQRDTIDRLARAHGLTIGEVVVEEDVSGYRRKVGERELGRLVEKVERGESEGIIAWKVSRFTRRLLDAVESVRRIQKAGGRFLAEDYDSSGPMANAMLGLLAGLGEDQGDAIAAQWAEARGRAIRRGVPNGRVPYGYRKRKDGRLEVDKAKAGQIVRAFELRAEGVAESEIARQMGWSHTTTRQRLVNETYLGVIRAGVDRVENAHPAIIEPTLWDRVQSARTPSPAATGELTATRLLQGLTRCGGCGRTLKVLHREPRKDGTRVSSYYCKNAASEPCPARAYVHCDVLEDYVCDVFEKALGSTPRLVDVVATGLELEAAQRAHEAAVDQRDAFVENFDARQKELFQRGYAKREQRVQETRAVVAQLSARLPKLPAGGSLLKLWKTFEPAERREVLNGFLGRVVVSRGASSSLAEHVVIEWSDGTVANEETRVGVAAA